MQEKVIVQKILSKRLHPLSNEIQYLLKWKDKPEHRSTWEPISRLSNIKNMIRLYENKKQQGGRKKKTKKYQEQNFQTEIKQIRELFKIKKDQKPIKLPFIKQIPEENESNQQQIKLFLQLDNSENTQKQEEQTRKSREQSIQKNKFYRDCHNGQCHSSWNSKWQRKWMSHYQDDTAQLYQVLNYPKVQKCKKKNEISNNQTSLRQREWIHQKSKQIQINNLKNTKSCTKQKLIRKSNKTKIKNLNPRTPLRQFSDQSFIPTFQFQSNQSSQPVQQLKQFSQSCLKQSSQVNHLSIEQVESQSESQTQLKRKKLVRQSISILRMEQNQDNDICFLVKLNGRIKWQNRQTLFQEHLEALCDYYERRLFQQIRKNKDDNYQKHKQNQY